MNTGNFIEQLEEAWDIDGFLGKLRRGKYASADGEAFLALISNLQLKEGVPIPYRMVSLLWYLPSFLEWQKPRIEENGGDVASYSRFVTSVHNRLEEILGTP